MQHGLAFDNDFIELTGCGEAVDDLTDARTGGQRRKEDFHVVARGGERLVQVERQQRGERGGLTGVGARLHGAKELAGDQLPFCGRAVGVGQRDDALDGPKLVERAECGGVGDALTEQRGELVRRHGALFLEQGEGFDS